MCQYAAACFHVSIHSKGLAMRWCACARACLDDDHVEQISPGATLRQIWVVRVAHHGVSVHVIRVRDQQEHLALQPSGAGEPAPSIEPSIRKRKHWQCTLCKSKIRSEITFSRPFGFQARCSENCGLSSNNGQHTSPLVLKNFPVWHRYVIWVIRA